MLEELTEADRARIGEAWLRDALAEHASIASFARFALFAMELGAPPAVLTGIAQAMKDETRHAQLCFGLAARFLGRTVGPGRIEIEAFGREAMTAAAILHGAIIEGCVGETIAAASVAQAAACCVDIEIRSALNGISRDEYDHAELAWTFIAWLLDRMPELIPEAREAFATAFDQRHFASDDLKLPPEAVRYGILPQDIRRRIRAVTIGKALRPRAAALCMNQLGMVDAEG